MAILSDNARLQIWRALQRYWSNLLELVNLSKSELLAAVVATDVYIDGIQGDYNSALPVAARTALSALQKTMLFSVVALARVTGGADLVRRLLGVEVD